MDSANSGNRLIGNNVGKLFVRRAHTVSLEWAVSYTDGDLNAVSVRVDDTNRTMVRFNKTTDRCGSTSGPESYKIKRG